MTPYANITWQHPWWSACLHPCWACMPSSTLISSDMGLFIDCSTAPIYWMQCDCNPWGTPSWPTAYAIYTITIRHLHNCQTGVVGDIWCQNLQFHNPLTRICEIKKFANGLPNCENYNSLVPQIFKRIQYGTSYLSHEGSCMHIDCVGLGHEAWTVKTTTYS